jgi:hypothetical protein
MPRTLGKTETVTEHPENANYAAETKLSSDHPQGLVSKPPYYITPLGGAYVGDSLEMLRSIPDGSINLVSPRHHTLCTSRKNTAMSPKTAT